MHQLCVEFVDFAHSHRLALTRGLYEEPLRSRLVWKLTNASITALARRNTVPEGDSLVRLAHRLRPVMAGQTLTHTDFRVLQLATQDLTGWIVSSVVPTGKYLSMTLGAPQHVDSTYSELVVLSHLGMDGSWQIDTQPSHRTRCILSFENHRVLGYSLSLLEVIPPSAKCERLSRLGPDILGPGWDDPATAATLVAKAVTNIQEVPQQPIGTALLDQQLVAGIGNIYRCEVLLLAGISPFRRVAELTTQQIEGLITLSHDIMSLNVPPASDAHSRRSTIDIRPDASQIFGLRVATPIERARASADRKHRRGKSPNYWVYGRQRSGCLRCGNPIRTDALGTEATVERTVYWCPNCQRG